MLPGPKLESCYISISKIAMFSPKKWFKNHNFGISTTESFLTLHTERLKILTILVEFFFLSKQTQYWLQSWRVYKSDFIAILIDLMFSCIDQRLSKPSERKLMVNGAILNLSSHTRDTSRKKKALPSNKNWQRFIHPSLEKLNDYFCNHWWKDLFSGTIIFSFFFPT